MDAADPIHVVGTLERQQVLSVIAAGGCAVVGGACLSDPADVPGDDELAQQQAAAAVVLVYAATASPLPVATSASTVPAPTYATPADVAAATDALRSEIMSLIQPTVPENAPTKQAAAYQMLANDKIVEADTTGGTFKVTFPPSAPANKRVCVMWYAGTVAPTYGGSGTDTLTVTTQLRTVGDSVEFTSDGAGHWIGQ